MEEEREKQYHVHVGRESFRHGRARRRKASLLTRRGSLRTVECGGRLKATVRDTAGNEEKRHGKSEIIDFIPV